MLCKNCICKKCPYGLKCDECTRTLYPHLHLNYGCDGLAEYRLCPMESYYGDKHALAFREIIKNNNFGKVNNYFDRENGAWYKSQSNVGGALI